MMEDYPDIELLIHPGMRMRQRVHGESSGRNAAEGTHAVFLDRRNVAPRAGIARRMNLPLARKWEFCTACAIKIPARLSIP